MNSIVRVRHVLFFAFICLAAAFVTVPKGVEALPSIASQLNLVVWGNQPTQPALDVVDARPGGDSFRVRQVATARVGSTPGGLPTTWLRVDGEGVIRPLNHVIVAYGKAIVTETPTPTPTPTFTSTPTLTATATITPTATP